MSLINYLDDMALAIKEKSGYEGKMKYSEMPEKIRELAFEDPTQVYKNNSVILRKGGLFVGENSNVAILDLGEPEQGNPTYTRFDLQPYYEGQETSGITVAVINHGYGNVYSLNTEIDHITSNSDGSAYTIKYGDEPNTIEVVETDFESSHGILFGENGYTCEVPHSNSAETAIIKFDSSGISCDMINTNDGDLFYPLSSSGRKYYDSTKLEDSQTYVLHAQAEGDNTIITNYIEAPNGFAFITSSGDNQTYDGYNYIRLLNSSGEEVNPTEIEEGKYQINYDYNLNQWQMRESLGPDLNDQSLYYYYLSSGQPTFSEVYLNSGSIYQYAGANQFDQLNSNCLVYIDGCGDFYTYVNLNPGHIYSYEYGDNFTDYNVGSGEIWQITGDSSVGYGMQNISDNLTDSCLYQYNQWSNTPFSSISEGYYEVRYDGTYYNILDYDGIYQRRNGSLETITTSFTFDSYGLYEMSNGWLSDVSGNVIGYLCMGNGYDNINIPNNVGDSTYVDINGYRYRLTKEEIPANN